MAKAKTLKPTLVREDTHGRIARWVIADGVVEADRRGVHLGVDIGQLEDVEELGLALKAAHLYYLNVKETM